MRPSLGISQSPETSTENSISNFLTSSETLVATIFLGIQPELLENFLSRRIIYNAFTKNKFMKHLKPCIIQEIIDSMYHEEYPEGSLIAKTEQVGKYITIVENGEFLIRVEGSSATIFGKPGKLYGEETFLTSHRNILEIKAISNCKVWMLKRKVFKSIMKKNGENTKRLEILKNFSWFKNVDEASLLKIADSIEMEYFSTNEVLELKNNILYIISNGSVKIIQKNASREKSAIRVLSRGDHFVGNTESCHKMIAFHPGVELLTFNSEHLQHLIGSNEYFRQEKVTCPPNENTKLKQECFCEVELKSLNRVSTLGRGNFGRVDLVSYSEDPNQQFALKRLEKYRTVQLRQQSHVIAEREILFSCKHPFIIRLYKTFRDDRYVYMLFEACLGGQVWEVMMKSGYFTNGTARFICACAIEALDYLHQRDIIYRDLKPDNMVIDQYGYVKLVDFGLSKHLGFTGRTWTFCGTPCNIAPEVILNVGHDKAVDFWALGLLVYELLCGRTAFADANPMKAYGQIMAGIERVRFPFQLMGLPAEDLVRKLCKQKPSERFGYHRIDDIREHRWFTGFDWNGLASQTLRPPKCLVPKIENSLDTSYSHVDVDSSETPPKEESNWDHVFE